MNVTFSGLKSCSGFINSGQNVLLPAAPLDYTELLLDPTFDAGNGSGSSWTYNLPGGGAANPYTTAGANIASPGALQLIGGSSPATGDSTLVTNGLYYALGRFVEASVLCSAVGPGDASLTLFWNPGTTLQSTVVTHPGGGYKQLKIGVFIPYNATNLFIRFTSASGKTNYFDNATLRAKTDAYDNRDYSWPTRNLPL